MDLLALALVGVIVGLTTVLFGFGGGFVTVPIIALADAALGGDAIRVATATSAMVMLVNAGVATLSTRRDVLATLRGRVPLFILLALGGALGAAIARFAPDALLRWGFVAYIGATVLDLLIRPGFVRPHPVAAPARPTATNAGVPSVLGMPIGAVASFLGVGGSVMTVPLLKRAGASMSTAAALANPLTLAIAAPALAVVLAASGSVPASAGFVGSVDVRSAIALLVGAMPVIVLLRRRPPRIPDTVHAWGYLLLLVVAGAAVAVA